MNNVVTIGKRVQPFIVVDQKIIKECRKRGSATSEMLLIYFTIQEMAASGAWSDELENHKVSELSGLHVDTVVRCLYELEALEVFA